MAGDESLRVDAVLVGEEPPPGPQVRGVGLLVRSPHRERPGHRAASSAYDRRSRRKTARYASISDAETKSAGACWRRCRPARPRRFALGPNDRPRDSTGRPQGRLGSVQRCPLLTRSYLCSERTCARRGGDAARVWEEG